ncbi:MAG TPA: TlpA disulfide reductase family protein [candidate division Zixibacteria bacterium]|nr:TlpA disulfide reductase family protein [candidate division Zixibacteria bacterium]
MNVDFTMRKNKVFLTITSIILLFNISIVIITSGERVSSPEDNLNINLLPIGSDSIDWELKEIRSGQNMTFSDFSGKIVILDFWEIKEDSYDIYLPILKRIKTEYSSSQLAIMSININPEGDTEEIIIDYIYNKDLTWYFFSDMLAIHLYYQVAYIPSFIIIDQNQRVYYSQVGIVELYDNLKTNIDALIESPPPTNPTGTGEPVGEFWQKYWYLFVIIPVFVIIVIVLVIQRQRIIKHNKKIREQKLEAKQKRARMRER